MKSKSPLKQIVYLFSLLILSWIIVHVVAVLGVFLAVALPILQLVFYPNITCFWCGLHKGALHKGWHSLIDTTLILLATGLSVLIVLGEVHLLSYLGIPVTQKTVQFVIPTKNTYKLGEIFPMKIEIKGVRVPINVVRTDLQFDPETLEVIDISTDESFAKIFIQKDINNDIGYARLAGGVPSPGYSDSSGIFGTVYFRGKKPGPVEISFLPTSLVLASDGKGTDVLVNLPSPTYIISSEKLPLDDNAFQEQLLNKRTKVLGAETNRATIFISGYDEAPPIPAVLGVSTNSLDDNSSSQTFMPSFANFLATVDNWIISFWHKVFQQIIALLSHGFNLVRLSP